MYNYSFVSLVARHHHCRKLVTRSQYTPTRYAQSYERPTDREELKGGRV